VSVAIVLIVIQILRGLGNQCIDLFTVTLLSLSASRVSDRESGEQSVLAGCEVPILGW
jgi:hypothetical protein